MLDTFWERHHKSLRGEPWHTDLCLRTDRQEVRQANVSVCCVPASPSTRRVLLSSQTLFFNNGPETQRGCVLFTAASSSRVMLSWLQQKTLKPVCKSRRPPPLHVCQQKPIVAAINTYKYWLNKRAFASVCAESVKVHSVPGKFLLHRLILKE